MYESSHKQPPSITYLILNSKDLVSKSINSEKQIFFFVCYFVRSLRGSAAPLCMGYNIITNLESTSWKFFVHQKQPPEASYKKSVSKNFLKVTGKHLCQSLSFDNVTDLRPATLLKKHKLRHSLFSWEFWETPLFLEHLEWLPLVSHFCHDISNTNNIKK